MSAVPHLNPPLEPEPRAHAASSTGWLDRMVTSRRFAPTALTLLVIWEFLALAFEARRTPMWYDEVLTFHMATLQPFALFWNALTALTDSMPVGYDLFTRLAIALPANPEVTLRLPSIIGYSLTLVGAYLFARRSLGAAAGLTAALIVALSPFRSFALDARSYALAVGFIAIAASLWQRAGEKWYVTPLLALSLTLAVACHQMVVVAVAPFALAELSATLSSRRIRWGIWVGFAAASVAFLANYPMLVRYRELFARYFWSRPDWSMMYYTYESYLGIGFRFIAAIGLLFALTALISRRRSTLERQDALNPSGFRADELLLVAGLLLYPGVLYLLTRIENAGYTPRYGLVGTLGLTWAIVYSTEAWARRHAMVYVSVALLLVAPLAGLRDLGAFLHDMRTGSPRPGDSWNGLAALSLAEPGIPVVVSDPLVYLVAYHYAPPALRERLIGIADPRMAAHHIGKDTAETINRLLANYVPLRVEDVAAFEPAHPRFILRSGGDNAWFTEFLLERGGYRFSRLAVQDGYPVFLVQREAPVIPRVESGDSAGSLNEEADAADIDRCVAHASRETCGGL